MTDLEYEFERLVKSLYAKIQAEHNDGLLTQQEADQLTDMVRDRLGISPESRGWDASSWCPGGVDDGWNNSGCSM